MVIKETCVARAEPSGFVCGFYLQKAKQCG